MSMSAEKERAVWRAFRCVLSGFQAEDRQGVKHALAALYDKGRDDVGPLRRLTPEQIEALRGPFDPARALVIDGAPGE